MRGKAFYEQGGGAVSEAAGFSFHMPLLLLATFTNFRGVYSFHSAGAFAGFADGTVRLLGTSITEQAFMAIITANGGEIIPANSAIY
jgi:hypothetical protein